jgi:hypothetical protein
MLVPPYTKDAAVIGWHPLRASLSLPVHSSQLRQASNTEENTSPFQAIEFPPPYQRLTGEQVAKVDDIVVMQGRARR